MVRVGTHSARLKGSFPDSFFCNVPISHFCVIFVAPSLFFFFLFVDELLTCHEPVKQPFRNLKNNITVLLWFCSVVEIHNFKLLHILKTGIMSLCIKALWQQFLYVYVSWMLFGRLWYVSSGSFMPKALTVMLPVQAVPNYS